MALPAFNFAPPQVKPRFNESYVSEAANTKFLGQPRGIYLGFTPTLTPGSLVLTLAIDPIYGISLARVKSSLEATNVDVVSDQPVTLDFTGHNFIANPTVYVKVHANSKLGSPTTAEVYTTATPGETPTDALIGVVTLAGPNTLAVASDAPTNRSTPYAFATAPLGYGFMQSDAVEELLASVAMVAEVAAARVDLNGVNHPYAPIPQQGIADRIAADLQPSAVASRLGRYLHVIRSADHSVPVTTSTINVSASFARTGRTRAPVTTIPAGGAENQTGAITGPSDPARNIAFVFVVGTNTRPIDVNRVVNYGRIVYLTLALTGTLTFSNVSTAVTGAGTLFTSETQVGDIIQAPDGDFYVIFSITNDLNLVLTAIPTVGGAVSSNRRRFNLNMRKVDPALGTEVPGSIAGGSTVRFFFSAYFDLSQSIHDSTLLMFEGGEAPPLPVATVAVKGTAIMYPGQTGALAGAVRVLDSGNPVGTGHPAYSLGFHSPPGQPAIPGASLNISPGIADVSAAGPIGPIGLPGTGPGPPGPPGNPGVGLNNFNVPFAASSFMEPPFGGWALGQVLTFDFTFPGNIKYLHGGIAGWHTNGPNVDGNDHFHITTVQLVNPTTGRIQNTISNQTDPDGPPNGGIKLFLNGGG